jgi:hypothetical protein
MDAIERRGGMREARRRPEASERSVYGWAKIREKKDASLQIPYQTSEEKSWSLR